VKTIISVATVLVSIFAIATGYGAETDIHESSSNNNTDATLLTQYYAALLGMLFTSSGHFREGAAALSIAIDGSRESGKFGSLYAYRAAIYEHDNNWNDAIRDYKLCIEYTEDNLLTEVASILVRTNIRSYCEGRTAICLWRRIAQYMQLHKYEEALQDCERIVAIVHDQPANVYYYIAAVADRAKRYDRAEYYLRQSLKKIPTQKNTLVVLGNLQKAMGRDLDAAESYNKALLLDKEDIALAHKLCATYLTLRQGSNAVRTLEYLGSSAMTNATTANNMACALMMLGKNKDALPYLSIAVSNAPSREMYRYNHAILLHRLRNYEEAAAELKTWAIMVDPDKGLKEMDATTNFASLENPALAVEIQNILLERKYDSQPERMERIRINSKYWPAFGTGNEQNPKSGEQGDGD